MSAFKLKPDFILALPQIVRLAPQPPSEPLLVVEFVPIAEFELAIPRRVRSRLR